MQQSRRYEEYEYEEKDRITYIYSRYDTVTTITAVLCITNENVQRLNRIITLTVLPRP